MFQSLTGEAGSSRVVDTSERLNVTSERDCQNLLLRELTALPERDPLAPGTISCTTPQLPLLTRRDTATDSTTRNNVWIARTVRAAMSDVFPKS
ncbi:uncharacterized protein QYS62_001523 [Fusarium acuminatum]|uniref:Uncharacterized protein n=1 Tax=Fusarium acuminatum TaxID=5515 RepID=A0ABZ2WJ90_9HYPO